MDTVLIQCMITWCGADCKWQFLAEVLRSLQVHRHLWIVAHSRACGAVSLESSQQTDA